MDTNDYPFAFRPNSGPPDVIRQHIEEVLERRHEHLEQYAAAFVAQVGSAEASKYQLIEQRAGLKVTWYFERRTDV